MNEIKYDIIVVAGQSNAEGNGLGNLRGKYLHKKKIDMLVDCNKPLITFDDNGVLQRQQLSLNIVSFGESKNSDGEMLGSFPLSFSSSYVDKGYLEFDRKVLLVNCAIGGTGFARYQWGNNTYLQNRMFEMIDYALSKGKDNRIVAFLWHQGEHDAFENSDLSIKTKKSYYYEKFKNLVCKFQEKYGNNIPIIGGDFSYEWINDGNFEQCKSISDATKKVLKEVGGAFVKTNGLQSNNQAVQNGDKIHFSRQSLYILGKRYFNKFTKIIIK